MKSHAAILLLLARSAAVAAGGTRPAESRRLRSVRRRPPSRPGHDTSVRRIEDRKALRGGSGDGPPKDLWNEPVTEEERRYIEHLVRRAGELLTSLHLLRPPLDEVERRYVERLERRAEEALRYLDCIESPKETLVEEERQRERPSKLAEERRSEDLERMKRAESLHERAAGLRNRLKDLERRAEGDVVSSHEEEPLSEEGSRRGANPTVEDTQELLDDLACTKKAREAAMVHRAIFHLAYS